MSDGVRWQYQGQLRKGEGREAAEIKARFLKLRLALEGLGNASVQGLRWVQSPHHRAVGLRAFGFQKSKLLTLPDPPHQVCEIWALAICPRKSKYWSFQRPEGGVGNGKEKRGIDNSTGRRGGAAAAVTEDFSSLVLGLGSFQGLLP